MTGIIRKPWGREYCAYRNAHVAIWVLEIRKGEATSLHAHPKKNTALIVLQGEVELSFIRGESRRFVGLDKINIFRGRFHRTRAISDNVVMLELEAPGEKNDIVRLEDDYGRVNDQIEDATELLTSEHLQLTMDVPARRWFGGCVLQVCNYAYRPIASIFVTLVGGLDHGLLPPGDAIDGASMHRLIGSFKIMPNSKFLQIRRTV